MNITPNYQLGFQSKSIKPVKEINTQKVVNALGIKTAAPIHGEYNSIAMVGDKAVVIRADLVKANSVIPHLPFAIQPVDVSVIAKKAEGPVLSCSYVKNV